MNKLNEVHELGRLIRQARNEQGLTQEQLSATSGVGVRFIRELEQGKDTCQIGKVFIVLNMLGIDAYFVKRGEV